MELTPPDEETMVRTAVADLDDRFTSIDKSHIETTVRRLVETWFARAGVKTYVGIIAERHAREELHEIAADSRGAAAS